MDQRKKHDIPFIIIFFPNNFDEMFLALHRDGRAILDPFKSEPTAANWF